MRLDAVLTVARKEMLETLRDRRTLVLMLVVPVLLYPLLSVVSVQLMAVLQSRVADKSLVIGHVPRPELYDETRLAALLEGRKLALRAVEDAAGAEALVRDGTLAGALVFEGATLPSAADAAQLATRIIFDSGEMESIEARNRLEEAVRAHGQDLVAERLTRLGQAPALIEPFAVARADVATAEQRGAFVLGGFLSFLLITMSLMGAFYPALDLTAGERDRGTLETLLVAPVSRHAMILGKYLTVLAISMLTALLNIASMGFTFSLLASSFSSRVGIEFHLSAPILLGILAVLLPCAALFSALCLGTASFARSYKEGQNYLTPLYMIVMFPSMLALIPGIKLNLVLAALPVAGPSLLFRELMLEKASLVHGLTVFGSTMLYSWLVLSWVAGLFDREEVLYRAPGRGGSLFKRPLRGEPLPTPMAAGGVFVVVLALFGLLSLGAGAEPQLFRALVLPQLLVLGLPLLVAWWVRHDLRNVFRWRAPGWLAWPGVLLIVAGELPLVERLVQLFDFEQDASVQALVEFVERLLAETGPWGALALLALLPAVCEEILCRGYVLSGLRRGMRPALALLISAVLFGFLHLSPLRFLPTLLLGVLLAFVVLRTGSLWPAILLHALHNGLAIAGSAPYATAHPEAISTLLAGHARVLTEQPPAISAALVVAGLGLVFLGGRRSHLAP